MLCLLFVHVCCMLVGWGAWWWVWSIVVTPTHLYRGTLEVESCAGAIPPPCTTCYNATIAPPCKHPEGGWVLVGAGGCSPCGRRVPRHPPRRHNTQHGTSPPAPGRAVHGPAGHQAGSTAADREVGGAQLSRDANANSWQLFAGTAKVVESCRKFSSETGCRCRGGKFTKSGRMRRIIEASKMAALWL